MYWGTQFAVALWDITSGGEAQEVDHICLASDTMLHVVLRIKSSSCVKDME